MFRAMFSTIIRSTTVSTASDIVHPCCCWPVSWTRRNEFHLVGHQLRIVLTMHGHTNIKTAYRCFIQNSYSSRLLDTFRRFEITYYLHHRAKVTRCPYPIRFSTKDARCMYESSQNQSTSTRYQHKKNSPSPNSRMSLSSTAHSC
jgi:hypothetical protein